MKKLFALLAVLGVVGTFVVNAGCGCDEDVNKDVAVEEVAEEVDAAE